MMMMTEEIIDESYSNLQGLKLTFPCSSPGWGKLTQPNPTQP